MCTHGMGYKELGVRSSNSQNHGSRVAYHTKDSVPSKVVAPSRDLGVQHAKNLSCGIYQTILWMYVKIIRFS